MSVERPEYGVGVSEKVVAVKGVPIGIKPPPMSGKVISKKIEGQRFMHMTSGLGIAEPKTGVRRTLMKPKHNDDATAESGAPLHVNALRQLGLGLGLVLELVTCEGMDARGENPKR